VYVGFQAEKGIGQGSPYHWMQRCEPRALGPSRGIYSRLQCNVSTLGSCTARMIQALRTQASDRGSTCLSLAQLKDATPGPGRGLCSWLHCTGLWLSGRCAGWCWRRDMNARWRPAGALWLVWHRLLPLRGIVEGHIRPCCLHDACRQPILSLIKSDVIRAHALTIIPLYLLGSGMMYLARQECILQSL